MDHSSHRLLTTGGSDKLQVKPTFLYESGKTDMRLTRTIHALPPAGPAFVRPHTLPILGLLLLLVLVNPHASAAGKMTIEDSLAIRSLSEVRWSPDSETLFFQVRDWDRDKNRYISHLYKLSRNGGEIVQLTRGEGSESQPSVSPDGKQLAFLASRGEKSKTQVHILPLVGGEAYPVTTAENGVLRYAWAPDGISLAFVTEDVRPDAEEREKQKDDKDDAIRVDRDFNWSHLWIQPLDDGEPRRLSDGEFSVSDLDWSPDGKQIAFQVSYTGIQASSYKHNDDRRDSDIFLVSAAGGAVENLTPGEGGRGLSPRWSPSGDRLAFSASPRAGRADKNDLIVMTVSNRETTNLTASHTESIRGAEWTRDGRALHFSEGDGTYTHLYSISASGGSPRKTSGGLGVVSSHSGSPDGNWLAFSKNDVDHPADLWVGRFDGSGNQRISDLNPALRDFEFSRTEVIRWQSTDGLEIEGILTYPLDYREGSKYPMILSIHGGPTGRSSHSFNSRNQIFAAKGYAILQPNPRGSTGYGMEFTKANMMDWGGKDFHDDDMMGVDKVIDLGVADPDKLVVMGGSYGGFSTFWAVTQTDRFKAAIGHAAISEWYSFYGQTSIPAYLQWGFGGHPWETREVYEKWSPYNFAQNVTTPLLITHGELDRTVPIAQAEMYYTLLKKLKKKVEFVRYPREGHGIREPNHVIDLVGRQLEWFDQALGIRRSAPAEVTSEKGTN